MGVATASSLAGPTVGVGAANRATTLWSASTWLSDNPRAERQPRVPGGGRRRRPYPHPSRGRNSRQSRVGRGANQQLFRNSTCLPANRRNTGFSPLIMRATHRSDCVFRGRTCSAPLFSGGGGKCSPKFDPFSTTLGAGFPAPFFFWLPSWPIRSRGVTDGVILPYDRAVAFQIALQRVQLTLSLNRAIAPLVRH
jgi:hypothetical protein